MPNKKTVMVAALLLSAFSLTFANSPVATSTLKKAETSISKGVDYLLSKQEKNGSWIHHPAVTGFCLMALYNSNCKTKSTKIQRAIRRGKAFILKFVQKDGSIWMAGEKNEYPSYTTAVSLVTLAVLGDKKDEPVMRKAREYLIDSQVKDEKNPGFGGIGYGKHSPDNPDLSNTQWALEALYLTDYLDEEPNADSPENKKRSDQVWKNAVQFLTKLQNLPETNKSVWVVKDKNNPDCGSFIYMPDNSKAGYEDDQKTLRGYGSTTYAGLKSIIYARLKPDDPRVKAAVEWGARHYTLEENPGMGAQGHFYYLLTFTKAYNIMNKSYLMTPDGMKHNWRADVVYELLKLQDSDGSWVNKKSGRWRESTPQLTTAYALIAMESALRLGAEKK